MRSFFLDIVPVLIMGLRWDWFWDWWVSVRVRKEPERESRSGSTSQSHKFILAMSTSSAVPARALLQATGMCSHFTFYIYHQRERARARKRESDKSDLHQTSCWVAFPTPHSHKAILDSSLPKINSFFFPIFDSNPVHIWVHLKDVRVNSINISTLSKRTCKIVV